MIGGRFHTETHSPRRRKAGRLSQRQRICALIRQAWADAERVTTTATIDCAHTESRLEVTLADGYNPDTYDQDTVERRCMGCRKLLEDLS